MSIGEYLEKIRNAVYGREVRESIAEGIETAYNDASEKHDNANMEVKLARGTHSNLNNRLKKMDEVDRETAMQLAHKISKGDVTVDDINKNKGKFDESYMEDSFLQQMTGDAPIHATPSDKSITKQKIADKAVNPEKLNNTIISSIYDQPYQPSYEYGSISSDKGEDSVETNTRIRTSGYIMSKGGFLVFDLLNELVEYNVIVYHTNGSFMESTGWLRDPYFELPENKKIRLVVRYKDDKEIIEKNELTKKIVFYIPMWVKKLQPKMFWKYGSIYSDGSGEDSGRTRLKSSYIEMNENTSVSVKRGYKLGVIFYDKGKDFVYGTGWVGNKYTFLDNNKVRLLLSRDDNESFTNVELNTVDTEILEIKENDISKTFAKKDVKEGLFFESTGYYWSDFTFIEGRLWAFRPSDYSGIAEGVGAIYVFDENMNLIKRLLHDFGHVNSIEYNSDNDTLIFGNGSGFYDTDGYIHIIEGVKHWLNLKNDTMLEMDKSIIGSRVVNVPLGKEFGGKVNVVWGEDNNKQGNICYVLSDDAQRVARVILGKGDTLLEKGELIEADINQFNGTFNIIKSWIAPETDVVQGACFYNNNLYIGLGHDGLWVLKYELPEDDENVVITERVEHFYGEDGTKLTTATEGVTVHNNLVYNAVFNDVKAIFTYRPF